MEKKLNFQNSDRGLEFMWKWKMSFILRTVKHTVILANCTTGA